MDVTVPFTNVQSCHDDLKAHAPTLWQAFETQVLPAAQADGKPWDRLSPTLDTADAAWASYLQGGGSPRVAESSWRCSVGDLGGALVAASVTAMQGDDDRVDTAKRLLGVVEERLADAPNFLMMKFALMGVQ